MVLILFSGVLALPVMAQEATSTDPWLEKVTASLGTRFGDLTERVTIGPAIDVEGNIPAALWVVMETRGGGYDISHSSEVRNGIFGRRYEGWERQVVMVRQGTNPADIARERYEKLSHVPECIKHGVNVASDKPEIFDVGPQVKILPVGPYHSLFALKEAEKDGKFTLGYKWNRSESDTRIWEGWGCEN